MYQHETHKQYLILTKKRDCGTAKQSSQVNETIHNLK